jgi:DNA-binding XRE family transcriptional regulator
MTATLGKMLRQLRLNDNKTQRDVAKYIGVVVSCIGHIEKGRATTTTKIIKYAEFLGYDVCVTLRKKRRKL